MAAAISLFLAGVLGLSGATKLADPAGTTTSLDGFGVPRRAVRLLAVGLPLLELALAAALLIPATARAGAIAALALFAAFAAAIGVTLARGRHPDCGCFGRLHSSPVGRATLARTAALAGLAAVPAFAGPGEGMETLLREPAAWLALLVAAQTVLLVVVLRRHGRLLARLETLDEQPSAAELALGAPAPDFELPELSGETVTLKQLRARGLPALLLFSDPGCGPCTMLLPELAGWQKRHRRRVTVALVSHGDHDSNRARAEEHGLDLVLLQNEREVAEAYGAQGTPAAVVVGPDGRIAGPLRYGADGARALLAQALEGSPVPTSVEFELPQATGGTLRSGDLRGRRTVLLFWRPDDSSSRDIRDRIVAWETAEHAEEHRLVVVSQGAADENLIAGFSSPVLLDDRLGLARRLGVTETPSALLLDEELRVASGIAVGAADVLKVVGADDDRLTSRVPALLAGATAAAAFVSPAAASPLDDEDEAIQKLKRILRSANPQLLQQSRRLVTTTRSFFRANGSSGARFELVAAIALMKNQIRRTKEELETVAVPDYRPGEKGARIAKSRATSSLAYLDLLLDRFAKVVQARSQAEIRRLNADIVRFAIEAENNRRAASRLLGCTRKLENC